MAQPAHGTCRLMLSVTAGFQACPWLIPEDIPHVRLQSRAGRILNLCSTRGNRTPGEPHPVGSRGTIPDAI